jgi:hypothetical protein
MRRFRSNLLCALLFVAVANCSVSNDGIVKQATVNSSSPAAVNGLECWMCKEILPDVKGHECAEKCSSWWHWTQAACKDVCEELLSICVDLGDKCEEMACETAGYC